MAWDNTAPSPNAPARIEVAVAAYGLDPSECFPGEEVDGYTLVEGDVIFIEDSLGADCGVYVVQAGTDPAAPQGYDTVADQLAGLPLGTRVLATGGTNHIGEVFHIFEDDAIKQWGFVAVPTAHDVAGDDAFSNTAPVAISV